MKEIINEHLDASEMQYSTEREKAFEHATITKNHCIEFAYFCIKNYWIPFEGMWHKNNISVTEDELFDIYIKQNK